METSVESDSEDEDILYTERTMGEEDPSSVSCHTLRATWEEYQEEMRATLSSLWLLPHLLGTVPCRLRGETAQVVPMLLHRTAERAESIRADMIAFQRLLLYMMMLWSHPEVAPGSRLQVGVLRAPEPRERAQDGEWR